MLKPEAHRNDSQRTLEGEGLHLSTPGLGSCWKEDAVADSEQHECVAVGKEYSRRTAPDQYQMCRLSDQ